MLQYIESGILELYVYGLLDEKDSNKFVSLKQWNSTIKQKIVAIEKWIIKLSSS